jgi:hypothetical protein
LATSTAVRPKPTTAELQALLPDRGRFTFPSPYNTTGVRLTTGQDCGGSDCVSALAGNGWQVMNNSTGSNFLYVMVALDRSSGGAGPSIIRFNKTTGETVNLGPMFDASDSRSWSNQEGWGFSPTQGTTVYLPIGTQFQRYDILTRATEVVFDITAQFGDDKEIWHAHSSHDGLVHSFALRPLDRTASPGCGVYREDTHQFSFFPGQSNLPECEVDKSGLWLIVKENGTASGEDDTRIVSQTRIINLALGTETTILEATGDPGVQDAGFGLLLAADRSNALPNAIRTWTFGPLTAGPLVYHSLPDLPLSFTQISFANARSASLDQQFACGGAVNRVNGPRANEIICIRLDGSLRTLVVAPVMTDLDAIGGGPDDDIIKQPYGMLDPTGEYFFWQSNVGGDRIDAFLVHAPTQLLVTAPSDITAPAVAITSPAASTVSGDVSLTATASDNRGVVGVQFKIDGVNLGGEIATAPYGWTWHTWTIPDGVHSLTAVARDAAGNFTVSLPVVVTVLNGAGGPQVADIAASNVTQTQATITWTSTQLADAQVDYGPTAAYGLSTTVNPALLATHLQLLTGLTPGMTYHFRVTSRNDQGGASSDDRTFTTVGPAIITNVNASSITLGSAMIGWLTNMGGTSQVDYGTTASYGHSTALASTLCTAHGVPLQSLTAATTYHYRVRSINASGLPATSDDHTFTTLAPPPAVILGVSVVSITRNSAVVIWATDQRTTSQVEYGLTTAYGRSTTLDRTLVTSHRQTLSGLTPGTVYHFRVKSTNADGLVKVSCDFTFKTPARDGDRDRDCDRDDDRDHDKDCDHNHDRNKSCNHNRRG